MRISCKLFLLGLLIILIGIVIGRSDVYRNLYGREDFRWGFTNFVATIAGGIKFIYEYIEYYRMETIDTTPVNNDEYDFIVVGAGTAGATLAARLSEIKSENVLLIEAGGRESLFEDVPLFAQVLQTRNDVNWKYETEPSNNYCRGLEGGRCLWPRGKIMGGSSVLNYLISTRGHTRDFDQWSEMGNEGWSYNDLLPYLIKYETVQDLDKRDPDRGTNGPISISKVIFEGPLPTAFVNAGVELGYNLIKINTNETTGFTLADLFMVNGTRCSSNRGYLHPIRDRKNLFVSQNSLVSKVLFNEDNTEAIGVEFFKNGFKYRVFAKKEVILTAGSIGSPQILMLSGIGPEKHLEEVGIKPIINLPVGENLMDHVSTGVAIFLIDQPVSNNMFDLFNPFNPYIRDFFFDRKGPYTTPGAGEGIAFVDTTGNKSNKYQYPDLELIFGATSFVTISAGRGNFGISDYVWNKVYAKYDGRPTWTILPLVLRPKSRGRILLRNRNINSKPRIYPNYLNDTEDVRVLVAGVKLAIEISKTKAMQQFNSQLISIPLPGCEHLVFNSDSYWECAVRSITFNIYHYSGTCKMGPREDPTAVIDSRLRVYGMKRLRVGDASMMPSIVAAHPNTHIYAIAEKLADMIKEDWGFLDSNNV